MGKAFRKILRVWGPGYPEYELVPGGAEVAVDECNVQDYIAAVVEATLRSGVDAQLTAFRYYAHLSGIGNDMP